MEHQQGVWVGVDVSKSELVEAVRPGGEFFTLANDERGVAQLSKRLSALGCTRTRDGADWRLRGGGGSGAVGARLASICGQCALD